MIRILQGDCRDVLRTLPDQSVQCCVTSPPYFGLRDYGVAGQIGLEPTPAEFVAEMVGVFREVRRVLRDDGTLWLNLGDSYCSTAPGTTITPEAMTGKHSNKGAYKRPQTPPGLKPKDLMGIPWRVAFALQDDGWYLRRDIIWSKPNPMPESCTDRPTTAHEYVFLLTKRARYFYDAEAIKEVGTVPAGTKGAKGSAERFAMEGVNSRPPEYKVYDGTRNARSVWTIATSPFAEAHFATFPPKLAETCILAGTSERGCCPACRAPWARVISVSYENPGNRTTNGPRSKERTHETVGFDVRLQKNSKTTGWRPTCACPPADPVPCVVLDPFGGAGTTSLVADRLNRDAILIELNPEYVAIASRRVTADAGMFTEIAAA